MVNLKNNMLIAGLGSPVVAIGYQHD